MENQSGHREFTFVHGPIFAQIVLADEINRATPKTQSALLEAMQEKQVTAGGEQRKLEEPFFVMANAKSAGARRHLSAPRGAARPIFLQAPRALFGPRGIESILDRTTTGHKVDIRPVLDAKKILGHQELVKRVVIAPHVQDYAIRCVLATHPQGQFAIPMVNQFLRVGSQPACGSGDHAWLKGTGAAGWPIPREQQGHQRSGGCGDAASSDPEL